MSSVSANPLAADLDHILDHTREGWEALRGERIFITGGTGFFGCWLLESFCWANQKLGLGAQAAVLSRDPAAFARRRPHLAFQPAVHWITGDIRSFSFPDGTFGMVIHAAAEASARLNHEQPFEMFSTIVDGARRALEFARARGSRRLLLTSSGAVYGKQPPGLSHIPEDYPGGPDPLDAAAAYAEGKRAAELLGRLACKPGQLDVKVARCFAFVGPYLPLDIHFAAGNFIRDGLRGGPISIGGDGTPYRSYLYAADLAIWLWRILWDGAPARAYNVGSEDALSIRELANQVAGCFDPAPAVQIARQPQPGVPAERYVPQTARAQQELGLRQWVDLADGLRRTIRWHQTISPVSAGTPHS